MFQGKLAVISIVSVALLCSVAMAQPQQLAGFTSPKLEPVDFNADSLLVSSSSSSVPEFSNPAALTRSVPVSPAVAEGPSTRPFRALSIGFTANTLGAGFELATPLSRSLNLRSGINLFSFTYPFNVDNVNYNSNFRLRSSTSTIDWFPGHRSFHISPGILYSRNALNAIVSVGPGQTFELGDQSFINSVNDPVGGAATVVFPHQIAPMLMIGFGNIIPRTGRHFSIPFEIGAAYTGSPRIDVNLNGTACTTDGCVNFASNAEAQASLKQEISDINEDLKRIPVYPIVSLGFAYRF
jgi:hypothetical protein